MDGVRTRTLGVARLELMGSCWPVIGRDDSSTVG